MAADITDKVTFGNPDDELLPLTKCACGAKWKQWSGPNISIYKEDPTECPSCGRMMYFTQQIHVFEVADGR